MAQDFLHGGILSIWFDPVGAEAQGEYVLIQNDQSMAVNITGWTLADSISHTYLFPSFTLAAGAFVKVWTGRGSDDAANLFAGRRAAIWNNTVTLEFCAMRTEPRSRGSPTAGSLVIS